MTLRETVSLSSPLGRALLKQEATAAFDFGDPVPATGPRCGAGRRRHPLEPLWADAAQLGEPMTASAGRSSSPPGWTRTTNIAVADLHLDISVIGFVISLATTTELADAAEATNKHLASGDFTRKAASIMPLVTSAAMWRIRAADPRAGLADGWRA